MAEGTELIQARIAKKEGELGKLRAKLNKANKVNISTLKVTDAVRKVVKSGRNAFTGYAIDPKTATVYKLSAVAVPVKNEVQS